MVMGRKAWLFTDTPAGANASARLYGLIETAKANGPEPYAYLRHVFTGLFIACAKSIRDFRSNSLHASISIAVDLPIIETSRCL